MAVLTRSRVDHRGRSRWRRGVAWLAALAGCVALAWAAPAEPTASTEYQLKAAFLYKLPQFVEWPASAFAEAGAPFVVGILGDDPFGAYLDDLVKGEKVGEHPMIVRRFKRAEDIVDCHILFVSRSESGGLDRALAPLKGRSVLTVSDVDTFITKHGGMVRFATENGKIKLKTNPRGARACDLTISSKIQSPGNTEEPDRR